MRFLSENFFASFAFFCGNSSAWNLNNIPRDEMTENIEWLEYALEQAFGKGDPLITGGHTEAEKMIPSPLRVGCLRLLPASGWILKA